MNNEMLVKFFKALLKAALPALAAWCGAASAGCALVPVIF